MRRPRRASRRSWSTPDEYREIRGHDNWFVIKPGHEKLDVERVVRERDAFLVVEKNGV
jgi:hypothetical protein